MRLRAVSDRPGLAAGIMTAEHGAYPIPGTSESHVSCLNSDPNDICASRCAYLASTATVVRNSTAQQS